MAAMREETELLSNTLREVAKSVLKDTDDTAKFVGGRSRGNSNVSFYLSVLHCCNIFDYF